MAATDQDPLLLLRQSIATSKPAIPTAAADPSAPEVPLAKATHLRFPHAANAVVPVTAPTRFAVSGKDINLRSIYFAWLNREVAIPNYNASAAKLNAELRDGTVQNLAFVERLDLISWLEGTNDESEYIKPLEGEAAAAAAKGAVTASLSRSGRGTLDPRLAAIYSHERRMGDRNTVLRGIKPTDFSHVRKLAAQFVQKKPQHPSTSSISDPSLSQKAPTRRPDPIILLSPSASSLLRMTNIRSFLEDGRYTPAEGPGTGTNMLHVMRTMRDIDSTRPMRFILVEGPEQFKPEYWNRVAAVFTTGQAWQFKSYKWREPQELFKHVLGIYVGWRGDVVPEAVQGWGHRVIPCAVDRWREGAGAGDAARFRDKEVVESIWKAIEASMRSKGWKRDSAPLKI